MRRRLVAVLRVCADAAWAPTSSASASAAPNSFLMVSPHPSADLVCDAWSVAQPAAFFQGFFAERGNRAGSILVVVAVSLAVVEDVGQPLHAAVEAPERRLAGTQRLVQRQALGRQPAALALEVARRR